MPASREHPSLKRSRSDLEVDCNIMIRIRAHKRSFGKTANSGADFGKKGSVLGMEEATQRVAICRHLKALLSAISSGSYQCRQHAESPRPLTTKGLFWTRRPQASATGRLEKLVSCEDAPASL